MSDAERERPRFRNILRRAVRIVTDETESSVPIASTGPVQARSIGTGLSQLSLAANASDKYVRVECWLHRDKLRWGEHQAKGTVIMYLTVNAVQDAGFDIQNFEIKLTFERGANSDSPAARAPIEQPGEQEDDDKNVVHLWEKPAPGELEDAQRGWHFSGHQQSSAEGHAAIACWQLKPLDGSSPIASCGDLHCGLALGHAGPTVPVNIQCEFKGHAVRVDDGEQSGYKRRFKFPAGRQDPSLWILPTRAAPDILLEEDIQNIERDIIERYRQAREVPVHLTIPTPHSSSSQAAPHVSEASSLGRLVQGSGYGTTSISGRATVIMGNVYTPSQQHQQHD